MGTNEQPKIHLQSSTKNDLKAMINDALSAIRDGSLQLPRKG